MKNYRSLLKRYRPQPPETVFAHFYPINGDYDEPFRILAGNTVDGQDAWSFRQDRFKLKYPHTEFPKLRNYLDYTFVRQLELEQESPGRHFLLTDTQDWICFNTGLQTQHGADLIATFQKYMPKVGATPKPVSDWVYKGCYTPNEPRYRTIFGNRIPDLAWYSKDSRDYVFDTSYSLDRDVFDHLFERAKGRAGLPNAPDEVVRNYLRGAIENLIPKILRNYKVAIPVYYVEEKRMQLLLPFVSASDANDVSCFLVDRDDENRVYRLKTIFDLDQAYFSARLITRPDREWLDP